MAPMPEPLWRSFVAWCGGILSPRLGGRRFDATTGTELAAVLAGVEDGAELERIGTLIIDCRSGADFLARARPRQS